MLFFLYLKDALHGICPHFITRDGEAWSIESMMDISTKFILSPSLNTQQFGIGFGIQIICPKSIFYSGK